MCAVIVEELILCVDFILIRLRTESIVTWMDEADEIHWKTLKHQRHTKKSLFSVVLILKPATSDHFGHLGAM